MGIFTGVLGAVSLFAFLAGAACILAASAKKAWSMRHTVRAERLRSIISSLEEELAEIDRRRMADLAAEFRLRNELDQARAALDEELKASP